MTAPRSRLLAAVAGVALAATGCAAGGGAGAAAARASTPAPGHTSYAAQADLAPCPSTTATAAGDLPRLTLPCLGTGAAVDLSRLRGPAVVNMWAQWCPPCVEEVPHLEAVHRAARGRLLVLGVDIQEPSRERPLAFAAAVGMTYPSVFDQDGEFRSAARLVAPPSTLFVDSGGRVVGRKLGLYRTEGELKADIARYLGVRL